MNDCKELIERLRTDSLDSRKASISIMDLCMDAAAAIETLVTQLTASEAARADIAKRLTLAQQERDVITKRMVELEQELANVKAERDAAVDDIEEIANGGKTWMCPYCKHAKNTDFGFADCEVMGACRKPHTAFVWRGAKEET